MSRGIDLVLALCWFGFIWKKITQFIYFMLTGGAKSLSGRPLQCLGMSSHFQLMYNMGTQLLHCGKALPAFECLIEAVQIYHINPHLWLRLAECCIMSYREVQCMKLTYKQLFSTKSLDLPSSNLVLSSRGTL